MKKSRSVSYSHWSTATIFFISVVVIALQLTLIRSMSVLRYYHFSYLVISTALLGFGASGTFLTFAYTSMKSRAADWILIFIVLFMISVPLCYLAATTLPLDVRFVFYSGRQLLYLLLYNLLMFIPFFLGAVIIGFLLTHFKDKVPSLYGANLLGSGGGALLAIGLMYVVSSARLPLIIGVFPLLALLCWTRETIDCERIRGLIPGSLIGCGLIAGGIFLYQPEFSVDPYKSYSHFKNLEQQGDAEQVLSSSGPRAQIDIFDSKTIHHTLFAGIQADTVPPPQMAVLLDGQMAAYMFQMKDSSAADILNFVPQSLPYRLIEQPDVLLLGEISGVNIWLAKRFGAKKVTAVQTNPRLLRLLADSLRSENGEIFHKDGVRTIAKHPRLFLEQTEEQYDIIQFVQAESMPAGSGGLRGLHENYLLTVEGIRAARDRLNSGGMLSLTRGMQTPPRDNVKIFSTMAAAFSGSSVESPGRHLFQGRNYLAVQTLLKKAPVTDSFVRRYREMADRLGLNISHAGDHPSDTTEWQTEFDRLDAGNQSWYGTAARAILSDNKEEFYKKWVYNVRPPTDDRPYFHDFFKWSSLPRFIEQYGMYWFRKIELGYAILALTFLELILAGFVLILLPLIILRNAFKNWNNTISILLYFGALGVGFLFLEMVYIQQFTKFMGDPVFSVAAALTAILVSSGIGSSVQDVLPGRPGQRIRIAGAAIVMIALFYLFQLNAMLDQFIHHSTAVRFLITVVFLFPVSFFLGWMFPNGMELLGKNRDRLVPWAWGVNGFLSVAASPLAVMLSMSIGFNGTVSCAIGCYILAAGTTYFWKN